MSRRLSILALGLVLGGAVLIGSRPPAAQEEMVTGVGGVAATKALDTSHMPMLSDPEGLAAALLDLAARPTRGSKATGGHCAATARTSRTVVPIGSPS